MNERLYNSIKIKKCFNIEAILVSYSNNLNMLGKFNISKITRFIRVVFALINKLLHKPDLVYFQLSPTGLPFFRDSINVIIMKIFRMKIIIHLRSKGIKDAVERNVVLEKYYRFIFKNTHVICLSEIVANDVMPIYNGTPYIVNNGIPKIKNYQGKVLQDLFDKQANILFLSNLMLTKGIIDFIEAISTLKNRRKNIKGIIAGYEYDLKSSDITDFINKYKLEDILEYVGSVNDEQKYHLFKKSDIFVFPTYNEVFGSVAIEAMQCEMPVITTKEGSLPVIIEDKVTGIFVDKKAPEQIADAIELLINDFDMYKQMAISARKAYLEKFTFSHYENNIISVFDRVINYGCND